MRNLWLPFEFKLLRLDWTDATFFRSVIKSTVKTTQTRFPFSSQREKRHLIQQTERIPFVEWCINIRCTKSRHQNIALENKTRIRTFPRHTNDAVRFCTHTPTLYKKKKTKVVQLWTWIPLNGSWNKSCKWAISRESAHSYSRHEKRQSKIYIFSVETSKFRLPLRVSAYNITGFAEQGLCGPLPRYICSALSFWSLVL